MVRLLRLLACASATLACFAPADTSRRHVERDALIDTAAEDLTQQESILLDSINNASIAEVSHYYTHGPHIGGGNKSMAVYTMAAWEKNGFSSSIVEYRESLQDFVSMRKLTPT